MAAYASAEDAQQSLGALFNELTRRPGFREGLTEAGISLLFKHTNPDVRIHVSSEGVLEGDAAPEHATLILRSSADTAHELWSGRTSFPAALTQGRLRIHGKVAKVLQLMPLLVPAFEIYPRVTSGVSSAQS